MFDSTIALSKPVPVASQVSAPKHERTSSKPSSQKKIEANRRNALRSTGPKTQSGKRAISRNAIKHGLLARQAVITRGHGAEYWRLARVLRFEVGEIRKRLDNAAVLHTLQKVNEANRNVVLLQMFERENLYERGTTDQKLSIKERFEVTQKLQSDLRTDPIGIDDLSNTLAAIKHEIQEKGSLSKESMEMLVCRIGCCDEYLVSACSSLEPSKNVAKDGTPEQSTGENSTARRGYVISLLDERLRRLVQLNELAENSRQLELDAQVMSLALPSEGATETILRYETHLDRQLYRAMDQLERMQRQRKSDNVPPPLNVNLGRKV